MKILILDDDLSRHQYFNRNLIGATRDQVCTADECIRLLRSKEVYDIIFLDHDLDPWHYLENNSNDKDGRWVVKTMINEELQRQAKIIVHSMNHICSLEMVKDLLSSKYGCCYIPQAWQKLTIVNGELTFFKKI